MEGRQGIGGHEGVGWGGVWEEGKSRAEKQRKGGEIKSFIMFRCLIMSFLSLVYLDKSPCLPFKSQCDLCHPRTGIFF